MTESEKTGVIAEQSGDLARVPLESAEASPSSNSSATRKSQWARRVFCLATLLVLDATVARSDDPPIHVYVGTGKAVTITVPHLSRADLIDIAGTFLGRQDPEATAKLKRVLQGAGDLTLTLTTRGEK